LIRKDWDKEWQNQKDAGLKRPEIGEEASVQVKRVEPGDEG